MIQNSERADETFELPAIVLVVEDDPEERHLYSTVLESSGMWVATATTPADAVGTILDLKPDVVVTVVEFAGFTRGLEIVDAIKHRPSMAHVPVVLLGERRPNPDVEANHAPADVFLLKPVPPEALVSHVTTLLKRSRESRMRGSATTAQSVDSMRASDALVAPATRRQEHVSVERGCPGCAQPLSWIETGRIDGVEFDYYHWCEAGCGLYCYERRAERWVRLAG